MESATELYIHGLEHEDASSQKLPDELLLKALARLARIYKRQQQYKQAISLWMQAASHRDLHAHVELAKYYEHHARNYEQAAGWTQAAIALAGSSSALPAYERRQWQEELEHRLARLARKIAAGQASHTPDRKG